MAGVGYAPRLKRPLPLCTGWCPQVSRLYTDRAARGYRHHRHSGRDAAAGAVESQAAGADRQLPKQPEAVEACWHLYADDYNEMLCPNDWIATMGGGSGADMAQTSWCWGNARTDTDTSGIQKGLLHPYNTSTAIYHCPADKSTIEDANGNPLPQLRGRSYNMSQSVNGYGGLIDPNLGYYVDALQPCFQKLSAITNPTPC